MEEAGDRETFLFRRVQEEQIALGLACRDCRREMEEVISLSNRARVKLNVFEKSTSETGERRRVHVGGSQRISLHGEKFLLGGGKGLGAATEKNVVPLKGGKSQ